MTGERDVEKVIERMLKERGVEFVVLEDGRYSVEHEDGKVSIYLDNIRRDYERDGDESAVSRFLDNTLRKGMFELPSWEQASGHVFPYLESAEVQIGEDTLRQPRSDKAIMVLTHYDEGAGSMRFLRGRDLEEWKVPADEAWQRAFDNLDALARDATVSFHEAGDFMLGFIEVHPPYKASMILARKLRQKVESTLGWPVYAVAPSRDFVYLVSTKMQSELGRLGTVVVREYKTSGYPVSAEVWELSDAGIETIGEFPLE